MSYMATPHPWCNLSPGELLMGRRMRTTIPQRSHWHHGHTLPYLSEKNKKTQKKNFDRWYSVIEQGSLPDDAVVWVTSETQPIQGWVVSHANNPRSYVVETPSGELQWNRTHLKVVPEQQTPTPSEQPQSKTRSSSKDHDPLSDRYYR